MTKKFEDSLTLGDRVRVAVLRSKTTLCGLKERVGFSLSSVCGAHNWFVWLKSNIERYSNCMWMTVFSMYFNNVLLMLGL